LVTLAMLPLLVLWLAALRRPTLIDPSEVTLGMPIGSGSFGAVHHAHFRGMRCVAKRATPSSEAAAGYLRTEACMNQKIFDAAPGSRYFAPLVGICRQAGVEYLLWEALPGADATLLNYLHTPWYGSLADALGIDCTTNRGTRDAALVRTSLHEMLSALRVVHGEGIVHRDVKPENWLVDRNSRSLRLIDLGAACEMDECEIGPSSELYAPPEQALGQEGHVRETYDIYSTGLVWLQIICRASRRQLGALRPLLSEALMGHKPCRALASTEYADVWERARVLFTRDDEGSRAWDLLKAMMMEDPRDRISAAKALASPYFG